MSALADTHYLLLIASSHPTFKDTSKSLTLMSREDGTQLVGGDIVTELDPNCHTQLAGCGEKQTSQKISKTFQTLA